jgi:hypothetical protein
MVKFITALLVFVAAVVLTLHFGAVKVHNCSSDNLELGVWVEPEEVGPSDGSFTIHCEILNLTGEPLEFDGFFYNCGPYLGWCSWTGTQPELIIQKPDGTWIDLMVYDRADPANESRSVRCVPEEGLSGSGTYSADELDLFPGRYNIVFRLMGKTREARFAVTQ